MPSLGNTGNNATDAQKKYLGSFSIFQAAYGTDLTTYIGAYGADSAGNVAWAVVNHNSDWAVVPEPGTMALLAFGSLAVLNLRRKKKTA